MDWVRRKLKKDFNFTILVLFTVFIAIGLEILLAPKIFSSRSLASMAYQIPEFGFIALAMMLAVLTGGIDLSAIANANLSGIIAGYILTGWLIKLNGTNTPFVIALAIVVALLLSTGLGLINGLLIAKLSVPPILVKLGSLLFYQGLGIAITSGKGVVVFPEGFLDIGIKSVFGIPIIFVLFILAVIAISIMLTKTSFGRKIYYYGENNIATRFAAIDNEKLIIKVYSICGFLAGIASIIIISRVNSAKVGYGDTFLLQALLVAVLGGVHPDGGKGRALGVMLSIFLLQMLQSAFTLWQFSPYAKKLIWGSALLFVMILNYLAENKQVFKIFRFKTPKVLKKEG